MCDYCGSGPTEATIGRERANDKRESAKEVFKFIVSPNRGVWVILPVKNPLKWKYLEVFKLNLSLEFVNKAEIVRTENKNTTAMFAAFQKILAELNNFPPLLRTVFASRALLACLTNFSLSDSFKNQLKMWPEKSSKCHVPGKSSWKCYVAGKSSWKCYVAGKVLGNVMWQEKVLGNVMCQGKVLGNVMWQEKSFLSIKLPSFQLQPLNANSSQRSMQSDKPQGFNSSAREPQNEGKTSSANTFKVRIWISQRFFVSITLCRVRF